MSKSPESQPPEPTPADLANLRELVDSAYDPAMHPPPIPRPKLSPEVLRELCGLVGDDLQNIINPWDDPRINF